MEQSSKDISSLVEPHWAEYIHAKVCNNGTVLTWCDDIITLRGAVRTPCPDTGESKRTSEQNKSMGLLVTFTMQKYNSLTALRGC